MLGEQREWLFGPPLILVTVCAAIFNQLQHFRHWLKSAPSTYKTLPFLHIRHDGYSKPPEELECAICDMAETSIQKNTKQQGYAVARNKLYNDKKGELRSRTFRCAMAANTRIWPSSVLPAAV